MKKRSTKNKVKRGKVILLTIVFLITLSAGVLIYSYYQKYSNRILPNIFIDGENYSNLTE